MQTPEDVAAKPVPAKDASEVAQERRCLLRKLAGAGGLVGLAMAALPKAARASPLQAPDGVEINLQNSDEGTLNIRDWGTVFTGNPPLAEQQSFRVLRADGAGYLSNNLFFYPSATGGDWTQDNPSGLSVVEEFGVGGWSMFLVPPTGSTVSVNSQLRTAINAEIEESAPHRVVVQVPQGRLLIGPVWTSVSLAKSDAALRVISGSTQARFQAGEENRKALVVVSDGPDANNSSYVALGVDPTGASIYGFSPAPGGAFVSAGNNGTGTARDLILHTYSAKDIVFATNNSEKGRIRASGEFELIGGIRLRTSTPNSTRLLVISDGPDGNNSGYMALGVDPNGASIYGSPGPGGAFVSAGKNGTGTARDLILHTYSAKDIVFATNNSEKARLLANGEFQLRGGIRLRETSSPTQSSDAAVIYAEDVNGKTRLRVKFADGTVTTLAQQP